MGFFDEFTDLMTDTLDIQPGATNHEGTFVASGSVSTVPCRIEGRSRMVRDLMGREVVSSVQVYVEAATLTVDRHRYTLPARFVPRSNLTAIAVERYADEDGPCYEVVMFA